MRIPYSITLQLSYACGQGWYEAQFFCILRVSTFTTRFRRGGRAVECTGLENQQGLIALRGFESHPLRQIRNPAFAGFFVWRRSWSDEEPCAKRQGSITGQESPGRRRRRRRPQGEDQGWSESIPPFRQIQLYVTDIKALYCEYFTYIKIVPSDFHSLSWISALVGFSNETP